MHNQLYKLSPDTFGVLARILKRVPNSKVWLLRFPPTREQRIRQEAIARGLTTDRLVFRDVAGKDKHVARARLGDLFLDTPTYNAHTTRTDVLSNQSLLSNQPLLTSSQYQRLMRKKLPKLFTNRSQWLPKNQSPLTLNPQ